MSWHGYFGDAGGLFGYPSQQEAAANYFGGIQNQMANAYNNQYNQAMCGYLQNSIHMPATPAPQSKGDCEGCGAPLKAHIHHCEYCRRSI